LQDAQLLTNVEIAKGSARYRSEVISAITKTLIDFNLLVDSLKALSKFPESHEKFRRMVTSVSHTFLSGNKEDVTLQFFNTTNIETRLQKAYEEWMKKNFFYLDEYLILVSQGVLESQPPYKLSAASGLTQELAFFEVAHDMTIVDIGTGLGHFPFILAFSGFRGHIVMTEISDDQLGFLHQKMGNFNFTDIHCSLRIIRGDTKNANLDSIQADRIFLRETFHHFRHREEMLHSLKGNLKPGGLICVREVVKDYTEDPKDECNKIIHREEIISSFQKAGFTLAGESKYDEDVMLKFRL
jgi:SAM-dependent methyltransferase